MVEIIFNNFIQQVTICYRSCFYLIVYRKHLKDYLKILKDYLKILKDYLKTLKDYLKTLKDYLIK